MINNKWYNMTNFVDIHPGGKKILKEFHKKDATERFYSIISHYNYLNTLEDFLITNKVLLDKLNKNKLNKSKLKISDV